MTAPYESTGRRVAEDEVCAQAVALRGHFTSMVRRRGVSRTDAEDIIQDFYLRVVRSASSLRERDKLRPWRYRVLWSALGDYLREQRAYRRAESAGRLVAAARCVSDAPLGGPETVQHTRMQAALPRLKREYAQTIERIDLANETADQVAAAHHATANKIRVRPFRACRALRAVLCNSAAPVLLALVSTAHLPERGKATNAEV